MDREPSAAARVAGLLWGHEYGPQRLSLADWYDTLDDARRRKCRNIVDAVRAHDARRVVPMTDGD